MSISVLSTSATLPRRLPVASKNNVNVNDGKVNRVKVNGVYVNRVSISLTAYYGSWGKYRWAVIGKCAAMGRTLEEAVAGAVARRTNFLRETA